MVSMLLQQTPMKPFSIFTVPLAIVAATLSQASVIHVPGDQPTIQAGINSAATGDTVRVDPGTYFENINFNGKAITVSSADGPAETIIDGGNFAPVAQFLTGETPSSVLKGFTLQHGTSTYSDGGGVFIWHCSPTIAENIIQENTACDGGGGIAIQFGSPLIENNRILNNSQAVCIGGIGGGGISVGGAGTARIIGNVIAGNTWASADGGGISLFASGAVTVRCNVIRGNSAAQGGGIWIVNDSPALIVQNLIYENSADQGAGIYFLVLGSSHGPTLVNNTIVNNTVTQQGSAIYASGYDNSVQVFNNLMIGERGKDAVFCDDTWSSQSPTVANSDAFSPDGTGLNGTCAGQATQNGNISADPKFVNNFSNFRLKAYSPAVDAGTNSAPLLPRKDLSGQPRIIDGNDDGTPTIDMGAYEDQ